MPRANGIRLFSHIGVHGLIFREHWVRSRAVKPFIVLLSTAGALIGCHHEPPIPSQPPKAVQLATVAGGLVSSESLRYSASIVPYAQVDLMFRSSGYVTNVRQVQGRDIGTGDYVAKNLTLAHIRREDLQNQVAQAQAQVDQAVAQHTKADQDLQ